jgi:16S rRNA (cytosine967-C5)-methyltransferase
VPVASLTARGAALAALRLWRKKPQPADGVIANVLSEQTLSIADRALVLELFYGVLRNLTLLDFWLSCLRRSRVDADVRDLVRLGLYQLLLLKIPEHAAVYESVELARGGQRRVINGILRNAIRQRETLLLKSGSQPLSIATSHPEFLVTRWRKNFGARSTADLCHWNNQPPPIYARINALKINDEEFSRRYPNAHRLEHYPGFFEFSTFASEALERGHCYIQDPSTSIACDLMAPQPGERILDACAAPGGKTALLAQMAKNEASIVASDRDQNRIDRMRQNFERLGVNISSVVECDWTKNRRTAFAGHQATFDRILVDAPCTNTGVMRRRVDLRWRLRATDFAWMRKEQLTILRHILPLLKPAGVLVYSTCSLEPEENEQVVKQLLAEFPNVRVIETRKSQPFRHGFDGAFAAKLMPDRS